MRSRFLAAILAAAALVAAYPSQAQTSGAAPRAESRAPSAKAPDAPVDINKASVADLTKVPGIGPSLAKRIVDFRDKNGAFGRVEDLLKIQGIGEKSLQRMAPHLTASRTK